MTTNRPKGRFGLSLPKRLCANSDFKRLVKLFRCYSDPPSLPNFASVSAQLNG